ncbi:disintegrin and metalloproteinase domain-containing protein 33-like [Arapaima gigas]
MYSGHQLRRAPVITGECGHSRLFFLLMLLNISPNTGRGDSRVPGQGWGQTVVPYWVSRGRTKRDTMIQTNFPAQGQMALMAEGSELLLLQLERNHQLLSQDFTETHYTQSGEPVTLRPNYTDHCYYHGHVSGHTNSWVVLSTCYGVRGLIVLNPNASYYLEPVKGLESPDHIIYRTEQIPIKGGTCGHGHQEGRLRQLSNLLQPFHRVRRNSGGTTKYMELYVVADHTLYRRQNSDLGKTKQRIMEIVNYVDKFYRALNIRVPLIGLEVWTERDQCRVMEDPNTTLWSFLQWKQKLKSRKKHDNAQLLTGVVFKGTTIGMAPLEGMCSPENSGGINVDHSDASIGAAATMAHEIGHNIGMSHDNEGCCVEATPEQGGCVMAAATGWVHPFPRVFSHCSKRDLDNFFQKGGGMCLFNIPDMKELAGGRRCGNGFVEQGEECDCGEPEDCTSACCNANNCTLTEGAQCAHGICCQDCQLKQGGTLCREPAGACDLPEYCTGASPYCPSNVYLMDGSPCQDGSAYCYNGMCLTHEQQCLQLWGSGARPAHDICFQDVNAAGNAFGNCGKNEQGNYVKCQKRDAKCGKIQCYSVAKKPKGSNAVSIDTTIRTNGVEVKCRGTYVYSTQDDPGDLPDPGLVMAGTKCGEGKVCRNRRCQNASFTELESCVARCHGHGVCNSNQNCHCDLGWAPPFCKKAGLGGSVDSGPIQYHSQQGLVVGLLLAFLVLLPAVLILFWCWKVQSSPFRQWWAQTDKSFVFWGSSASFFRKKMAGRKVKKGSSEAKEVNHRPGDHGVCCSAHLCFSVQVPHSAKEALPLRPIPDSVHSQPLTEFGPLRPARCPLALPHQSPAHLTLSVDKPTPTSTGPIQTKLTTLSPVKCSVVSQLRPPSCPPPRPPPPNLSATQNGLHSAKPLPPLSMSVLKGSPMSAPFLSKK